MKNSLTKKIDAESVAKLAKFIEDAVEGLREDSATCYRYELACGLSVYVGWNDGFADDDESVIHDAVKPSWAICVGVKRDAYLWCDYDWLLYPMDEHGEPVVDEYSVNPQEDYKSLASYLFADYFTALRYQRD